MAQQTTTAGGSILLDVVALRSGVAYRAAELMRRRMGAAVMASCPPTSEEYAAIRLLVATWDAIAARVRAGDIPVDPFFETNPVSHMWEALVSAINIIKGTTPGYADNFRWLYKRYKKWLDQSDKSRRYRTAARGGMNSGFG